MKNLNFYNKRILFFGRAKCNLSESILKQLKSLNFDVTFVESYKRGQKLTDEILTWEGDIILCFRSLFILPRILLKKAKVAAINFHPGPPEYPGSGCINFALYDNVEVFGVTAHLMNENIDNGDIIEVRRFSVFPSDDLPTLLERTHKELFNLCTDFIKELNLIDEKIIKQKVSASKKERWKGEARLLSELENLQTISLEISKKELKRIIRATYIKGYPPKIKLHGFNFFLELNN